MLLFLVRVTGLEPVRHNHTPLKRACLPIPAHSQKLKKDELMAALGWLGREGKITITENDEDIIVALV